MQTQTAMQQTPRKSNAETGPSYYRARYYHPQLQRFITEDPIGFGGGDANLYGYVWNSPADVSDALGLNGKYKCALFGGCSKFPFGPRSPKPAPPTAGRQCKCAPSGSAPSPQFYADLGNSAGWFENDVNLSEFRRGDILDAQVQYGGSQAYANYVFGVYMASAGYSLSDTLSAADTYGQLLSKYPPQTQMGLNYPHIPESNVTNITQGFHDTQNGLLCNPY